VANRNIETINNGEKMSSKGMYIFKSSLIGLISYTVAAFIYAFVNFQFFGSNQTHGMEWVPFILLPLYFGPIGLIIGLVSSLLVNDFRRVIIILTIGLVLVVSFTLLYLFR